MKGTKRKSGVWFVLAAVAFLISSLSVIAVMAAAPPLLNGLAFWLGLLLGILMYVVALVSLPERGRKKGRRIPGLFRFFSNPPAIAADTVMILSLLLTIYFGVNIGSNQTAAGVILFLLICSIYAHVLLNGKVYIYLRTNNRRRNR